MRKLIPIGLNTLKGFANPLFNFLTAIIGVNYFGKSNWGIIISILLWVYVINLISSWGNKEFLIRQFSNNNAEIGTVFYSNVFTRSCLLLICSSLFIWFPFEIAIIATLLSFLIFFYSSLESLVIYKQKFGQQLIAETLAFLTVVLGIININSFNTTIVLKLICFAFTIKIVFLSFFTIPHVVFKNIKPNFNYYKQSFPFFLIGFSGWLISKADVYVISLFLEKDVLASYQIFISAFLMLQAISALTVTPFTKQIYRLPINSINNIKNSLALIGIPFTIIGSLLIWYTLEFVLKLNMAFYFYILACISTLPSYFYIVNIYNLYKKNKEKMVMAINLITGISNVILGLILIQYYQVLGILISVIFNQILQLSLYKYYDKN